jgi:endonuclease-3
MKKKATKRRSDGATKTRPVHPSPKRRRGASPARGRESDVIRRARAGRILQALREAYPNATCALHHDSALTLLVATILSAQCTDERVNLVTPDLFRRYPDARALAAADVADLEAAIRSTGFYHNKAKSLLGMSRMLCDEHGGEVPDTMEALLRLPGVARKTANCVLGTWYGKNEGIVVDTHVGRVAMRLKLAPTARTDKDAEKIERDLTELFPRETWTWLAHALIEHGRKICIARKPECEVCPLAPHCPSAFTFP